MAFGQEAGRAALESPRSPPWPAGRTLGAGTFRICRGWQAPRGVTTRSSQEGAVLTSGSWRFGSRCHADCSVSERTAGPSVTREKVAACGQPQPRERCRLRAGSAVILRIGAQARHSGLCMPPHVKESLGSPTEAGGRRGTEGEGTGPFASIPASNTPSRDRKACS